MYGRSRVNVKVTDTSLNFTLNFTLALSNIVPIILTPLKIMRRWKPTLSVQLTEMTLL